MKITRLAYAVLISFAAILMVVLHFSGNDLATIEENVTGNKSKMSLRDRMDLAMLQEFERTKDPETGRVPRERLMDAYNVIRAKQSRHDKAAISGITWSERGPNNVGGRTRTIVFDESDPTHKTVFAGSVSGGLWKTTNVYGTPIEWTPVNDFFSNMAITSIAQDPTNPAIMYFGTGEGYFNIDAVQGDGIWKSTDTGSTWTQLAATTNDNFSYISKIIVDGSGNVIVGTRGYYINNGGVYRSTNGGNSFTEVLERYTTTSSAEYDRCADIELAADGKTFFASFGIGTSDGIFKSTDSAKSFSSVYNANTNSERRIDIVCAPSDVDYVYALVQSSGNPIEKIMKSTDGGSNWTSCTTIEWYDQCGSTKSTDFTRNQAWYNLASVVDPSDKETLYVGGINLFKTTNAGTSWTQLSSWVGCGGYSEVHSDHHVLIFAPGSDDTMLNGNDGGIYLTENVQSSPPTWTMINNGYNVTQFYAGAIHPSPLVNYFLTGSQDNGSQRFQSGGVNSTDEVTGGDGGFCHIDTEHPDTQITAYTNNNIRISTDGFSTYTSYSSGKGNFINASDYDSDNKILYAGSDAGYFYRWSNIGGTPSQTNISISAMNGSQASAVLVSPSNPTTIYLGTEAGRVVKVTNANGSPSATNISTGLPTSVTVSCIAEDPFDASHLLVTYSNYGATSVYESTNGGTSWSSVEGDLPDMPVRWALFSPWGGDSVLLATELGVWSTTNLNGGSTSWDVSNTGLANCRVDMLQYRESDSLVLAATHGRGVFTTKFFSNRIVAQIASSGSVAYVGEEIDFYDDSFGATSWSWDFDNDGISESTDQNTSYAFGEGGLYTVKLTINGSLTTTKSIQILPNLAVPYTTSDGGDMESNPWHFAGKIVSGGTQLWERGAPSNGFNTSDYNGSNAWVTDLDADMVDADIECALLTPSFNFSESGTYTLSFVKSMEITYCNGPLASQVQYSTDKGITWTRLGTDATGTNWYNRGPSSGCQISTSIFSDEMGWAGNYSKSASSHDVSSLAGNADVRFRILFEVSDNFSNGFSNAGFLVDDFTISGPTNKKITGGGIETGMYTKTLDLPGNDSAHYYSNSGKLIASIWNLGSHNFGATTVEIDAVGSGAKNFSTNTANGQKILDKTIKITPTTNNGTASVKIALYYTAEELSGWKSTTGEYAKDVQLFKTTNSISTSTVAQGTAPTSSERDSTFNGDDICVIGTFTNGFSGVGAGGGGNGGAGPLPVSWLSFEVKKGTSTENMLRWVTGSEINNERFDIQRSIDGDDFEVIGSIMGQGNSYEVNTYSFIDNSQKSLLAMTVCYRIKQIDFDGNFDFSNIRCLDNAQKRGVVKVGPNPISDKLRISCDEWEYSSVSVELVDLSGKTVMKKTTLTSRSTNMDVSEIQAGILFIIIRRNDEVVRVIKQVKL